MKCKGCGASIDLTMSECPACGTSVEFGRLTGILGMVCRACDAYNEPGARTCASCGKPLGAEAPAPSPPAAAPPAAASGTPVVRSFPKPGPAAATRFVPSVLRPSPAKPGPPALTPVPLVSVCPRCGEDAGTGRFCSRCGQPLEAKGTQVVARPSVPGRSAGPAAAPLAPGRASLVLEAGEGPPGATFALEGATMAAGRSKGAVVFPEDDCLAALHATFFYRAGSLHVRDEGAPGGVYLRLRGISVPLRPGDHFALGGRLLRYAGPLPPAPPPPPDGTQRLGSPRPPAPAVVVEECLEGGASGRVFLRGGPAVSIGRTGCSVNLGDDPYLSDVHAEILVDANGVARLKDLASATGTYLKIPPHGERELHDGDRVRMGREVLRVAVG